MAKCRVCDRMIDEGSDRFGLWYRSVYDDMDIHGSLCMKCSQKLLPIIMDKMCDIIDAEKRIKAKAEKENKK